MTKQAVLVEYRGFEQGPIRPPSEADSLLLRISRNCPWNRCTFCSIYKRASFSLRPLEHVLQDIDSVHHYLTLLQERAAEAGGLHPRLVTELAQDLSAAGQLALHAAYNWLGAGMQSIFLQDANSLVIKPDELVVILQQIRQRFPQVQRITSYARSQTIDRISADDLQRLAAAGLNRIHIGMESGSDAVLRLVQKGTDQAMHIRAGQKVKRAGMQLSEYVMPGLGGRALSRQHALETATALNEIDADFIRLRTLAVPKHTELYSAWQAGSFVKLCDKEVAEEILLFLETLDGISSTLKSDHILNLFQEIEGCYPVDKVAMTGVIRDFFALSEEEQLLYQVGRRMGLFAQLADLQRPDRRQRAVAACAQFGITTDNIDTTITELMQRFI